ncbi:MAG TPA: hypothetical protein VGK19_04125 [Capsulimonadaceae bacterium]|jgi:lipopolysaccharide export system protein LptA
MKRNLSFALALATVALSITASLAAPVVPTKSAGGIGKPGKITLTAKSSSASQGAIIYTDAHMVTDNGATLDAAEIKAVLAKSASGSGLDRVIATGHVKGVVDQAETGRKYTIFADKGVYNPKLNQIDLTGSVKIQIDSNYTQGPLIQTGNAAVVKLGTGPDYPIITMTEVQTTFTLTQ